MDKISINAERYISKENFIQTFSYESLPPKDKKIFPPHNFINPNEITPTEYDTWEEFKEDEMVKEKEKKYINSLIEKIKKGIPIPPILVEKLHYGWYAVMDGHHRVYAHQLANKDIPVYYTDKELGYLWDSFHPNEKKYWEVGGFVKCEHCGK